MIKMKIGIYAAFIVAMSISDLAIAQETNNDNKSAAANSAMLPKVPVAEVIQRHIIPSAEFTGYLASPKTVDVRPRVGGRINSVDIPEGQRVKKGDLLFQIDPQPFQIALLEAEGKLSQAEALAAQANRNYQRLKGLINKGAVSRKDYDDALAILTANNAQVKSAKAAVASAKLNLSYTKIHSPIAGRVDRALITEGNLVTGGETNEATRLTTVVSIDPIYAYFDIDEATFHKLTDLYSSSIKNTDVSLPPVTITLPNNKSTPYIGNLNFIGNQIERTTGTVKVRAVIDNKDGKLIPGAFIRAQLPIGEKSPSILIDDQAIGSNQGQNYVLVLDKNNKAEYRPVELGAMVDGLRVINHGLIAGEKIIIKGLVRPGMEVAPVAMQSTPAAETTPSTTNNKQTTANKVEEKQ
ncbi:efflux RND transporter periplasmic adaptor subunit [Providencia sp. PROV149]|uniref:efflux RND transporter periplasmic adaptor subunit n=1 Tax=Providencia sp. PROV149 TaxID=2949859 RepID=UPI00234A005F|nr:efflux RND transporter periplasmic adaptor subunit [Providencia sp. PROV149]